VLGSKREATPTIRLTYKTSRNRLPLVGFINNSRCSGNLANTQVGGLALLLGSRLDMTRLSTMKIACHDSLDLLFQNLGIWISGSGAAGHVSSATHFSNLLEDKDRRLKIELTLSLILRVSLRLGGYSIDYFDYLFRKKTSREWASHCR
jgi:hypothetical protein